MYKNKIHIGLKQNYWLHGSSYYHLKKGVFQYIHNSVAIIKLTNFQFAPMDDSAVFYCYSHKYQENLSLI